MRWSASVAFEFETSAHLHLARALEIASSDGPPGGPDAWAVDDRRITVDASLDSPRPIVEAAFHVLEHLAEMAISGEAVFESQAHGRRAMRANARTLPELPDIRDELPTLPMAPRRR